MKAFFIAGVTVCFGWMETNCSYGKLLRPI